MTNSLYKSAIKLAIRNGKYILLGIAILFFLFWLRLNPILVEQYTVKYEDIVSEVMGTGTLEAHVETVISSKISGLLTHVNVDQGDSIKNGQVLARLDDRDLIQQVEIAKADFEAAKATVTRAQADVNRARAVCEQAQRDNVRNQELFRKGTISESEDEKSTEALKIAEAELAREKAAAAETEKQLIVAKNTLEYHRARLADTVINAPFDGLIIRRDREPGDVVVPGSSIFLLISTKEMWIKAWVDETQIGKLSPRQKARIIFRSEPDDTYQGGIVRIGRESDRETRELLVDVLIDKLPSQWAVGQRAEVYIEVDQKQQTLVIPVRFISIEKNHPGVFVLNKERAIWHPVKIGLQGQGKVEILEGLDPNDTVITSLDPRQNPLSDGKRVKVTTS